MIHVKPLPIPLNYTLNMCVSRMVAELMPDGFDTTDDDALNSFDALKDRFAATGRVAVWTGESDRTIYGLPSVNHAFRAWHDFRHISENVDFTFEGERRAMLAQIADVSSILGARHPAFMDCARLLTCEIEGQSLFFDAWGAFPTDQKGFARAALRDGLPLTVDNGACFLA